MKRMPLALAAAVLALSVSPIYAEKLPEEFRFAFEKGFRKKSTFAVVVQPGIPTTSIYGVNGNETDGYYSIDVVDGDWKTSDGLMDTNQSAADFLRKGEIVEITDVSFKNNRVDLRTTSLEAHKVTRGDWLLKDTKPEPVSTNFKFFLPYPKDKVLTSADVPDALEYVKKYLKPFPNEEEARVFSAQVIASGGKTADAPRKTEKKEIKVGMSPLDVIDTLGKPTKEVTFENQARWTYPDLTVTFENGKVKEVKF